MFHEPYRDREPDLHAGHRGNREGGAAAGGPTRGLEAWGYGGERHAASRDPLTARVHVTIVDIPFAVA
ncbi:hypothetical protein GCM10025331_57320 [Actinoplanes utahensis]|nr:hypothetical protein Aut01nite_59150 [Actinoplanes utahensis]